MVENVGFGFGALWGAFGVWLTLLGSSNKESCKSDKNLKFIITQQRKLLSQLITHN